VLDGGGSIMTVRSVGTGTHLERFWHSHCDDAELLRPTADPAVDDVHRLAISNDRWVSI